MAVGILCLLLAAWVAWSLLRPRVEVVLEAPGPRRVAVIKAVRELGGLSLLEAKLAVDAQGVLARDLTPQEAERWARALRAHGARVRVAGARLLPRRVRVARTERAAVRAGGVYERLLGPGAHWLGSGRALERLDLEDPRVPASLRAALLADPSAAPELEVLDLARDQRALVWVSGRLRAILDPGRHALWRAAGARVEHLEQGPDGRVEYAHLEALRAVAAPGQLQWLEVGVGERGFLYADGRFVAELGPGRHAVWGGVAEHRLQRIEVRPHWVRCGGPLAVTCADRVPVGCELDLELAADDPRWAAEAAQDSEASLTRQAEGALRAAVGQRALEALLADPGELEQALRAPLEEAAERLGWRLCRLRAGVVSLPEGVERAALRALEATEAARADRVRRREETAATRAQLNTARMVASCPTLLRLKELEAAQSLAARGAFVGVGAQPAAALTRLLGRA